MHVDKRWVGAILRLTREYRGVTREQMAVECGVSAGTISHWETGRVLLNAAQLATWARVCGVDLELLAREAGLLDTAADPPPPSTLRAFYRARNGTIPASVGGIATAQDGGTAASGGGKRQLPLAKAPFARVLLAAAAF
jgi:transcriptional regulator with XRE-family HTH domain